MPAFSGEASHTYFFRREVSASRILQVPDALFLGFFQKLFADGLAAGKNFSLPTGETIRKFLAFHAFHANSNCNVKNKCFTSKNTEQ